MIFVLGFAAGAVTVVLVSMLAIGLCAAAAMQPAPSQEQKDRAALTAAADRLGRGAGE